MQPLNRKSKIPCIDIEASESRINGSIRIVQTGKQSFLQRSILLSPHRKNYYLLVYAMEGKGRHWIDMVPYDVKANTFYFTIPEQVHLKEEADFIGISIAFTEEFFAHDFNHHLKKLPIIQNLQNAHELILSDQDRVYIEDILDKLTSEYQSINKWQNEMIFAHMNVLLIYLSRLYTIQYKSEVLYSERESLNNFHSLIEANYKTIHEVNTYANLMNVTVNQLNSMIKQQSGKTPIVHIHERLVLEAKRLLFHTPHAIKEIAFDLGFEDASYFNRFFKRLTNLTPLTYRENCG